MPFFNEERTEPATPKRREEARREGNVPKTRELPSALIILCLGILFYFYGKSFLDHLMKLFPLFWKDISAQSGPDQILHIYFIATKLLMTILTPIFITIVFISLFSHLIQTGFIFSIEVLTPRFSRLNPINGIKRLFSLSALIELLKSSVKLFIIGYIAYRILSAEVNRIIFCLSGSIYQILLYTAKLSFKLIFNCGIAFLALSLLDYIYQRYQYEQNLKMTKQEVKEEMKQREGDPLIKSRIKSLQKKMAMSRMMQEVPKADVVITNPTRIAVALRYDSKSMYAPKVVAKGYGFIAAKIKEIAQRYGIPIIENKWLARMLISVEVGEYIPSKLYRAVAEILAYIYQIKGRTY